jgi:hypothetical protein
VIRTRQTLSEETSLPSCSLRLTEFVKGCRFLPITIKGSDILFISEILAKCRDL